MRPWPQPPSRPVGVGVGAGPQRPRTTRWTSRGHHPRCVCVCVCVCVLGGGGKGYVRVAAVGESLRHSHLVRGYVGVVALCTPSSASLWLCVCPRVGAPGSCHIATACLLYSPHVGAPVSFAGGGLVTSPRHTCLALCVLRGRLA
jgi:hypothetical protein